MRCFLTLLLGAGILFSASAQEQGTDPGKKQAPKPVLKTPLGGLKDQQLRFGPDFVKNLPEKDRQKNSAKQPDRPDTGR